MRKVAVGSVLALAVVTNLFFVNCGGLKTSSLGNPSGGQLGGVNDGSTFGGTWIGHTCAPVGAESARDVLLLATSSSSLILMKKTTQSFGTGNCSGNGILLSYPMDLGSVTLTTDQTYNGRRFFRGDWADPVTGPSKLIWILKNPNTLCVIYDNNPTSFPTVQDIDAMVDHFGEDICYTKQ